MRVRQSEQTKPLKEFFEAEPDLMAMKFQAGAWRLGAVRFKGRGYIASEAGADVVPELQDFDGWRVLMQVDDLPYDVVVGLVYDTSDEALAEAERIALSLGGTSDGAHQEQVADPT